MINLSLTLALALSIIQQVGWVIPFQYKTKMTNCWLESSTDMKTWHNESFDIETNLNGTTGWVIHNSGEPYKLFRVAGEKQ